MIKQLIPAALLGAILFWNTGCKNGASGGFTPYKGIEYKIVKEGHGKKLMSGDIVEYNIIAKVDTMTLGDSRKQQNGKPAVTRVQEPMKSGQWQAVFSKLSVGDSAIVEVSCDTILKSLASANQSQLPPWLKKGNKITMSIAVVSDKTMDEYQKEMSAQREQDQAAEKAAGEKQMPIDDQQLQSYFAAKHIKAEKTPSGLYYTIEKAGSGPQIEKGQTVSMMYTGKTLDGKAFDSNVDTAIGHHGNKPLNFRVGMGQMIPGVDEGVALLKKGSKATFYLPSPLAYGAHGAGPSVGPNSILIFDVDITDVKATSDKESLQAAASPQQ